jgi:hypothetical protein
MKTIRHNTYETNSSSTHSITIDTENYKNVQIPKMLTIPLGEFGWEFQKFNDFLRKASYFWTLALYNAEVNDRMIRLAADHGLDLQFKQSKDDFYYVDHGSVHYCDWVKKNPELLTDEGLWNFLINESCWIILGNDNNYDPPNWRITEKAAKALEYEVYICSDSADDYVNVSDCTFKTDKGTVAENKEAIKRHVFYMLDNERDDRKWDDPYPSIKEVSDEGIIMISYEKYDHSTKEYKVHRTRKLRAVVKKVKKL